jgi:ketosteroid isomerase-like protein
MSGSSAVRDTLERFWAGWRSLNVDAILATLVRDETLTFIGTDAEEYWQGIDAVAEPFRAMTAAFAEEQVAWDPGDPRIDVAGDIAWASGRLHAAVVLRDGSPAESDLRTTYVLRRLGGQWQIALAHISVAPPAPVAAY